MPDAGPPNNVIYTKGRDIKLFEFNIYDRWGKRVFYTTDMSAGWDGTFNGKAMQMDTYTYYIRAITNADTEIIKQGNITLIR